MDLYTCNSCGYKQPYAAGGCDNCKHSYLTYQGEAEYEDFDSDSTDADEEDEWWSNYSTYVYKHSL